jgi:predicted nucleic acid-binding protein
MKENDRLKSSASKILAGIESGRINNVYASAAVIQEIVFWLLNEDRSGDILKTVNSLLSIRNLEWVDLSKDICLNAAALIEEYKISPFDAYHAATAISRDSKIASSDHVYDRIKSIQRTELSSV